MAKRSPVENQAPAIPGAHLSLQIGNAVAFKADITTTGLLAVSALVCASLLGSAAIVLAARSGGTVALKRLEGGG